tara:strand:+ start:1895 stop:2281 length:387 start_codon:yes stop_codon:yes gene_type:complete
MKVFSSLFFTGTVSASILLITTQAKNFAWRCIGPQSIGNGLRIIEIQEPGSEIVRIRDSSNKIVIEFFAKGPKTKEVLSGVGRNGENGIIHKRIYADSNGTRWIYKNWDAHPTFQSTQNSESNISCTP